MAAPKGSPQPPGTASPRPVRQAAAARRSPVQRVALVFGIVFFIMGVAGFIPIFTIDYSAAGTGSTASQAALASSLQVSLLHNVVHLVYGLLGFIVAVSRRASMTYLLAGGVALWLYALAVTLRPVVMFMPLESGRDWLHFFFGTAMVCAAFALLFWRRRTERGDDPDTLP